MRILHLDSGREMRGGQWQVLHLLRGLRERGHPVKLLARRAGPLFASAAAEEFDVKPVGIASFAKELGSADIVHAHDGRTHTLACTSGTRLVVSRRVAFPVRTGPLSQWKYSRPDHYIAISQYVAEKLAAASVGADRITIVHDGVPPIAVPVVAPSGRVVAPATEDPMKGSDLVRAAARIAHVDVLFSEALTSDLPAAGVFIYLTREEGLGSAVLLAMAHAVPVVASRVGGLPEIVEHGRTGLLVDNDPTDIADAVRLLLHDREFAQRLGAQGRERVERDFSLDQMIDGTLRVYERLLHD